MASYIPCAHGSSHRDRSKHPFIFSYHQPRPHPVPTSIIMIERCLNLPRPQSSAATTLSVVEALVLSVIEASVVSVAEASLPPVATGSSNTLPEASAPAITGASVRSVAEALVFSVIEASVLSVAGASVPSMAATSSNGVAVRDNCSKASITVVNLRAVVEWNKLPWLVGWSVQQNNRRFLVSSFGYLGGGRPTLQGKS